MKNERETQTHRHRDTQGRRPSEDGGRDWRVKAIMPRNTKDCWPPPEAKKKQWGILL